MVLVDDDEREVAFEPRVDGANGFDEIAVVGGLEQVRDRLRRRSASRRRGPRACELVTELAVVLDDPVQDDREIVVIAASERVRVVLGDAAVGRPARVAETGRGERAVRAGRLA